MAMSRKAVKILLLCGFMYDKGCSLRVFPKEIIQIILTVYSPLKFGVGRAKNGDYPGWYQVTSSLLRDSEFSALFHAFYTRPGRGPPPAYPKRPLKALETFNAGDVSFGTPTDWLHLGEDSLTGFPREGSYTEYKKDCYYSLAHAGRNEDYANFIPSGQLLFCYHNGYKPGEHVASLYVNRPFSLDK